MTTKRKTFGGYYLKMITFAKKILPNGKYKEILKKEH